MNDPVDYASHRHPKNSKIAWKLRHSPLQKRLASDFSLLTIQFFTLNKESPGGSIERDPDIAKIIDSFAIAALTLGNHRNTLPSHV